MNGTRAQRFAAKLAQLDRRPAAQRLYKPNAVDRLMTELTVISLACAAIPLNSQSRSPCRKIMAAIRRASKLRLQEVPS